MDSERAGRVRPRRVPLGPRGRRLSFERGLRGKLWLLALPGAVLLGTVMRGMGLTAIVGAMLGLAVCWAVAVSLLMESIVRPLQTLGNVIAALREDDFSFRARGGRRNDAVGDLAIEVNALAGMLQAQRGNALEAVVLAERIVAAMQTPVLAFDANGHLRMLNPAAGTAFDLDSKGAVGKTAGELRLQPLLWARPEDPVSLDGGAPGRNTGVGAGKGARWIVHRAAFRMRGAPHVLAVLSEASSALREEERNAWQRLVRVMAHEINNSLAPIKSIAGSLRGRLPSGAGEAMPVSLAADLERGLGVIENRAESLNRFLQAYRQLSGLPRPRLAAVPASLLVERVAHLVDGVAIRIERGAEGTTLRIDEDQMQQALINLLKNAVEAALSGEELRVSLQAPEVTIGWNVDAGGTVLFVEDNGPGILNAANLFVPFYTTKPGGTGIGLALARQIAEAHGGTVRLAGRADAAGCRAELRLPAT